MPLPISPQPHPPTPSRVVVPDTSVHAGADIPRDQAPPDCERLRRRCCGHAPAKTPAARTPSSIHAPTTGLPTATTGLSTSTTRVPTPTRVPTSAARLSTPTTGVPASLLKERGSPIPAHSICISLHPCLSPKNTKAIVSLTVQSFKQDAAAAVAGISKQKTNQDNRVRVREKGQNSGVA